MAPPSPIPVPGLSSPVQLDRIRQESTLYDAASTANHGSVPNGSPRLDPQDAQSPPPTGCICYPWLLSFGARQHSTTPAGALMLTSSFHVEFQEPSQELTERVDAFFEHEYPLPSYSFLQPASTRARCITGKLEKSLALSICGLTFLHSGTRRTNFGNSLMAQCPCRGRSWVQAAERHVWQNLEYPTISRLQALLLIINYWMETGCFQRAFMLAATAARSAVAMRLNRERPDLPLALQEVRRRIAWSLKLTDRYFSIGLPEWELCPFEIINLPSPYPDEKFSAALTEDALITGRAVSGGPPDHLNDHGSYELCVSLESLRRGIMKMNRDIAQCNEPYPELPRLVADFEGRLSNMTSQMPDGTDFRYVEIARVLETPWLSRRVLMHLSWQQQVF